MKRNFKKKLALLLAVVLMITTSAIAYMAYADVSGKASNEEATVVCVINDKTFPDDNFRAVISDWYDDNGDGSLDTNEVNVSFMSLSAMVDYTCGEGAKITDLKGIEYFSKLKVFRASGIGIQKFDCTSLPNLIELTVLGNELTSLNLSWSPNIEVLNCASNELTSLDLLNNGKLRELYAYANHISNIKFPGTASTNLEILSIYQNEFTSLDVSNFANLTIFNCSHNHLTSLDLSKNTKIDAITDATIGNQTVSAEARLDKENIYVYFIVPNWNTNLVSTSVDKTVTSEEAGTYTQLGYDGVDFTPSSCDDIKDGITYYYNVGIADAENMDVHLDVNRDFWQVKYYTDASKTTLYEKQIVYNGNNATEPTNIGIPQCKKFVMWSNNSKNITADREIYAIWADDHNIVPQKFEGGIVDFDCTKCRNQKNDYDFSLFINMRSDNEYFAPLLDQNNDNIINAKDYALIKKALK